MLPQKAKYIVQYKNRFTVCLDNPELEQCIEYRHYCSTLIINTTYIIDEEGILIIEGQQVEYKWLRNIPYFEDGEGPEGMESYDKCVRVRDRKYGFFGKVIRDDMHARFKRYIPVKISTSNYELIEKDFKNASSKLK